MARPNWEYIRVDVLLPEHPKIEGLSDKAFRVLLELWCYCGRQRTDGIVTAKRWKAAGAPAARRELIDNDLVQPMPLGGVVMHDFLDHQRSREQIDELAAKRSEAGRKAAESRWGRRDALPVAKRMPKRMRAASRPHMRIRCLGRGRGRGISAGARPVPPADYPFEITDLDLTATVIAK